MLETSDTLLALGGSMSGIIAAVLYAVYRNKNVTVSQIQGAETVKLGSELEKRLVLKDDHCIAYAAVEGLVADLGKIFSTRNSMKQGVVLHTALVEHKSKRTQGFWADMKKVLRDTLDVAPFALRDSDTGHLILVTEATEAEGLLEDLEVTHNQFIPHKTSAVQAGIDRIFGEVCRGIQETEEMLVVGTSLMGIGEIFLEDGRVKIRPPETDSAKYFLTQLSKNQLIKKLQSQSLTLKIFTVIFGVVATSLIGFMIWRLAKRYLELKKTQKDFDEIRRSALRRRGEAREPTARGEDDSCVVCLSHPREVVTLDCGHISMCSDCAQLLPQPHKCPVCRDVIERFLPVYRP
ncbi:mitochondrial ubiquitin ligase activator of NFKB 1-like [Littorina saxatilis]|uniref:RING-type E3 ubiquitin transferase n=1 Tax=Littorina saxatilis TaxID=31220 RepID=A0AAN9FVS2_9CAEN